MQKNQQESAFGNAEEIENLSEMICTYLEPNLQVLQKDPTCWTSQVDQCRDFVATVRKLDKLVYAYCFVHTKERQMIVLDLKSQVNFAYIFLFYERCCSWLIMHDQYDAALCALKVIIHVALPFFERLSICLNEKLEYLPYDTRAAGASFCSFAALCCFRMPSVSVDEGFEFAHMAENYLNLKMPIAKAIDMIRSNDSNLHEIENVVRQSRRTIMSQHEEYKHVLKNLFSRQGLKTIRITLFCAYAEGYLNKNNLNPVLAENYCDAANRLHHVFSSDSTMRILPPTMIIELYVKIGMSYRQMKQSHRAIRSFGRAYQLESRWNQFLISYMQQANSKSADVMPLNLKHTYVSKKKKLLFDFSDQKIQETQLLLERSTHNLKSTQFALNLTKKAQYEQLKEKLQKKVFSPSIEIRFNDEYQELVLVYQSTALLLSHHCELELCGLQCHIDKQNLSIQIQNSTELSVRRLKNTLRLAKVYLDRVERARQQQFLKLEQSLQCEAIVDNTPEISMGTRFDQSLSASESVEQISPVRLKIKTRKGLSEEQQLQLKEEQNPVQCISWGNLHGKPLPKYHPALGIVYPIPNPDVVCFSLPMGLFYAYIDRDALCDIDPVLLDDFEERLATGKIVSKGDVHGIRCTVGELGHDTDYLFKINIHGEDYRLYGRLVATIHLEDGSQKRLIAFDQALTHKMTLNKTERSTLSL